MNQWPHVSSRISLEDTWGFAYRGDTPACMAEIVGIPPKFACCFSRATRHVLRPSTFRRIVYEVRKELINEYGAMAQLVAHLHGMERVRGSNPLSSTMRCFFEYLSLIR